VINLRLYLCALGVAGALCVPALAQEHQQDQNRYDNANVQADRDHAHSTDEAHAQDQERKDGVYNNHDNAQWRNTKAWQEGYKDGKHDRSKNAAERLDRHHWKHDNDRMAYEAGYRDAYNGRDMNDRDHDRDRDRDHDKNKDRDRDH